jgi:DUF4097 and DUF4098 domain-containing protein YvlB
MSTKRNSRYLVVAILLSAACGREMRHGLNSETITINRTWPAESIRELKVTEVDGSVKITASKTNEIRLVAEASGRDLEPKAGAENSGLFETRLEGSTLHIGHHEEKHFNIPFMFGRRDLRINYTLEIPATVSVDATTVNGRIAMKGIDGTTEAVSVNGSIDIETAGTNELRASTVNGHVAAKFLTSFQGARFKTVNGGVDVKLPSNASFSVDLAQINGDFEAAFPLSIHSNPGSRRVSGDVNGGAHQLKIVTVNGDVELARLNDL